MTQAEKQEIVAAVLESIKAQSTSIPQMTLVSSVPDTAYVEINGGRRISLSTIINEAVTRALNEADIDALSQRIETINTTLASQIRTLADSISSIPVITVDDELSVSSTNPVQNKVVTGAINNISNVANAFIVLPHFGTVPSFEASGFIWNNYCTLVTVENNGSMYVACKYVPSIGGIPGEPRFYLQWGGHPDGLDSDVMNGIEKLYAIEGVIYQGSGRVAKSLRTLGSMLAQHEIISQGEYDNMTEAQKEVFSLYLTY